MHRLRNMYKHASTLVWVLLLSVFLRSLIAPGFMLDTSGDEPFEINITLCEGLNGVNAIEGMEHMHHDHHGMHDGGDDQNHDHEPDHFTATCGLWSGSSTFIEIVALDNDYLLQGNGHEHVLQYFTPYIKTNYRQKHQPRAPPVIRTV